MKSEVSSEEKLLHLIRNKDKGEQASKRALKKAKNRPSAGSFLKQGNRLLILCVIAAVVLVSYKFMFTNQADETVSLTEEKLQNVNVKVISKVIEQEDFSTYLNQTLDRDLFLAPWDSEATLNPNSGTVPMSNLAKDFKVVGIVLDDDPKAIIEDVKGKQTYFVSKGESVNEALVKEIYADKVVLEYRGALVELTP